MRFRHAPQVWSTYPELVCGVLHATSIAPTADVGSRLARYADLARARLADGPEGGFPAIQAWRRAFAPMGLPPTRYRCAAESLLRRFRRECALPRLHPLVDLTRCPSATPCRWPSSTPTGSPATWPCDRPPARRRT